MKPTLLVAALLLSSCAAPPARLATSVFERPDPRVGQFVSSPWTFETSTFWIEGPTGLVLIDTQFLPGALEKAVGYAEGVTGKKVQLAIVLHANPDKFNGTAWLNSRGVRVVTSEQVRALIPAVHEKRVAAFYERYAKDGYPRELRLPDSFGAATTELSAGGVTVKAHVLGAGCSDAHVVVEWEGNLFVGDLVANGAHAWLELGHTEAWLKRLEELAALQPKRVHPGRGVSGGPELLDAQREYLQTVIALVSEEEPVGGAKREALARILEKMNQRYPAHRYPVFLRLGLPAEWARQAGAVPKGAH